MSDHADRHGVLYWNRATPELYAVIRDIDVSERNVVNIAR